MKKYMLLSVILVLILGLSACTGANKKASGSSDVSGEVDVSAPSEVETSDDPNASSTSETSDKDDTVSAVPSRGESFMTMLETMDESQYTGLTVDAFVKERKAILPGNSFRVSVVVNNSGDKTVVYQMGSGSYTTPNSLYVGFDGLQTVIPEDYLGPTTMDMRYDTLNPGESKEYSYTIMAIKPDAKFDDYTYEFMSDRSLYIGEKALPELLEFFPELKAVEAGSYEGKAYFYYSVYDVATESSEVAYSMDQPVYSTGDITVSVG